MKELITSLLLVATISTFAQTGIGTTTPNTNAQLEVASTNKGFLPPRVALTGTTSASPLAAHVEGMVVYNTATISDVTPGLYVNNGTVWEKQIGVTSINDLSDGKSDGKSIYLGLNSGKNYTGNGFSSVGIGEEALSTNVSGIRNVAVGFYSLNKSTADDNTAIGAQSMQNNLIGAANTAIGTLAMNGSAQGQYNTAIGASALSAPDGALTVGNTAIGGLSLGSHSIGSYNVALGFQSGYSNITGAGNIFLGYQAGYNEAGSNKLYIENSNSATPLIYGDFATNLARINGTFEVSGSIKIEGGTPGVGKVLTSDANGLASWLTPAAAPATTDALTEGTTNLYYTEARVSANTNVAANTAKTGITSTQSNAIVSNTAKVTNATHTGDVTGSTVLTIGNAKVTNAKVATGINATKLANGTVSNTELQYINTVSSNVQTQLNAKQATITGAATTIASANLIANRAVISNASGKVGASSIITTTELEYLNNVSSAIQTQLDAAEQYSIFTLSASSTSYLAVGNHCPFNTTFTSNNTMGLITLYTTPYTTTLGSTGLGRVKLKGGYRYKISGYVRSGGTSPYFGYSIYNATTNALYGTYGGGFSSPNQDLNTGDQGSHAFLSPVTDTLIQLKLTGGTIVSWYKGNNNLAGSYLLVQCLGKI